MKVERSALKVRRLFVIGIALVLGSFSLLGHAAAQAPTTFDGLTKLLATQSDVQGTGLRLLPPDLQDTLPGNVIYVARSFGATNLDGTSIAFVFLFTGSDGSAPDATVTSSVSSGAFIKQVAQLIGMQPDGFMVTGSQGAGSLDQSAQFNGSLSGDNFTVYADSWVHNTVVGTLLYLAPADQADTSVALKILRAQDARLP